MAGDARLLTAYGTLYRALARLEKMGLLESRWEDLRAAVQANRPGRRFYTLTAAGDAALVEIRRRVRVTARRKRLVPA